MLDAGDDEPVPPFVPKESTSGNDTDTERQAAVAAEQQQAAGLAASSSGSDSEGDGTVRIDLQLPRRSLLVQFTCNVCQGRSERLVNPVAWHRGMVSWVVLGGGLGHTDKRYVPAAACLSCVGVRSFIAQQPEAPCPQH